MAAAPDVEPVEPASWRLALHLDRVHRASRWAFPHEREELIEPLRWSLGDQLDGAVGAVHDPALESKAGRGTHHEPPEADTLDLPPDDGVQSLRVPRGSRCGRSDPRPRDEHAVEDELGAGVGLERSRPAVEAVQERHELRLRDGRRRGVELLEDAEVTHPTAGTARDHREVATHLPPDGQHLAGRAASLGGLRARG